MPNTFPKNSPTKYASFTLKGYFALPLIPYLNGFAPGEEIFSKNPSRREGHYCPNPLTRSHLKTGVFGGWDGVLSSLSHPKSIQAGRESKGTALASISHLSEVSGGKRKAKQTMWRFVALPPRNWGNKIRVHANKEFKDTKALKYIFIL